MLQKKEIQSFTTYRLVKSEDLNHHGTLFAGRTAEWFVESGFVSAAALINPKHVVCLKIHGMYFTKPVKPGQIVNFTSKIVYTGNTSLVSHIQVTSTDSEEPIVSGFITFIHVNEATKSTPHNIEILSQNRWRQNLIRISKKSEKEIIAELIKKKPFNTFAEGLLFLR